MSQTMFDCARVPGDTCSLQLIGERKDVQEAAKAHLISAHPAAVNEPNLEANLNSVLDSHAKLYDSWI